MVVRLWCWIDMQHGYSDRWDWVSVFTQGHYQGQGEPWMLDPLHLIFHIPNHPLLVWFSPSLQHHWLSHLTHTHTRTHARKILFIFPRKGLWWLSQERFSYNWALFLRLPLFFSSFSLRLLIHVQQHGCIWLQQCSFPCSVYEALGLSLREASLFSSFYP